MRLRAFTEPQQGATYAEIAALAHRAEDAGYDAFFRSDHYLVMGSGDGRPGPTDAWTTLAGLAVETSRIRLGTLVTSMTFRLPGPLAISVAQIDAMSGGRIEFGLGAGWYDQEHRAYGIPFPPLGERFDRLEEQLEVITGLWRTPDGQRYDFVGKHYRFEDSPALPKPVQRPHPPVIVGGHGLKRTPALAARYADEFNVTFPTVEGARESYERVRAACVAIGREALPVWSAMLVVCCGRTDAEIARRAAAIGRDVAELRENGLCGTPAEIVDRLGAYAGAGVDRMYLQMLDVRDLDQVDLIASEVMPHV